MKTNLYKVVYSDYVGDNRAGGYTDLTVYVETLDEVIRYRDKLKSVTPIKAAFQPALAFEEIFNYFDKRKEQKKAKQKKDEIKSLKRQLKKLEDENHVREPSQ